MLNKSKIFSKHLLYTHVSYFNRVSISMFSISMLAASYFYDLAGGCRSWAAYVDTFFHQFTQTGPVVPRDVSSARALWDGRPMDQGVGHL